MPIYEYRCDACENVFEEWHRHADDLTQVPCPVCHKAAHRLISNTTFVLKGGGWYVTEYGNRKDQASAPAAAKDKAGTSPAPEAKTDAAPASADSGTPAPVPAPAKAETTTAAAS